MGGSLEKFVLDRIFNLDRNLEFFDLWALWVHFWKNALEKILENFKRF